MWADLVCPFDQGTLQAAGDWLCCRACGRGYPVIDGIPTFLPVDEHPRWRRYQRQQVRRILDGQPPETAADAEHLRFRSRGLEARLSPFLRLSARSRILQVGVTGQSELHHLRAGSRYAVEPLAGVLAAKGRLRHGPVRWIAGRGEELPFADGYFDLILLPDVLEASEEPAAVLAEAARCLAPQGVIWVTSHIQPQPAPAATAGLRLVAPPHAAVEPLWHFSSRDLESLCRQAALQPLWRRQSQRPDLRGPQPTAATASAILRQSLILARALGRPRLKIAAPGSLAA